MAGGKKEMKYVLVTGGVVSGLGKGVTASSIGLLLQTCDLRVTSIKIGSNLSVLWRIHKFPSLVSLILFSITYFLLGLGCFSLSLSRVVHL